MIQSNLPSWFKIWWMFNLILTIVFFIYWISIDLQTNNIVLLFIVYANLWGLWAAKYRREKFITKNNN